jgi:hypothetical protein
MLQVFTAVPFEQRSKVMANNTSRGGMKQSDEQHQHGKKHQGVRLGSSAFRKERRQVEKRRPAFDEDEERRSRTTKARQPAKRGKGPAVKKLQEEAPGKHARIKAGAGKKNLYANMPKARKVR